MRSSYRPAVAAALLLFAACSDGGSSTAPTTAPEPTVATTTTEPKFSGAGSERFCTEDRAARERLLGLNRGGEVSDALRLQYTTTAESLRTLSGVAPDEIASDLRLLSRAYDALVEAMQRANWDASQVLTEVNQKLGGEDVKVASERLQAYERQICGISG